MPNDINVDVTLLGQLGVSILLAWQGTTELSPIWKKQAAENKTKKDTEGRG